MHRLNRDQRSLEAVSVDVRAALLYKLALAVLWSALAAALYCETATGNSSSYVYSRSLTAILVQSVAFGAAHTPHGARSGARADQLQDFSPTAPPR